jgi:hypothetical protein
LESLKTEIDAGEMHSLWGSRSSLLLSPLWGKYSVSQSKASAKSLKDEEQKYIARIKALLDSAKLFKISSSIRASEPATLYELMLSVANFIGCDVRNITGFEWAKLNLCGPILKV